MGAVTEGKGARHKGGRYKTGVESHASVGAGFKPALTAAKSDGAFAKHPWLL